MTEAPPSPFGQHPLRHPEVRVQRASKDAATRSPLPRHPESLPTGPTRGCDPGPEPGEPRRTQQPGHPPPSHPEVRVQRASKDATTGSSALFHASRLPHRALPHQRRGSQKLNYAPTKRVSSLSNYRKLDRPARNPDCSALGRLLPVATTGDADPADVLEHVTPTGRVIAATRQQGARRCRDGSGGRMLRGSPSGSDGPGSSHAPTCLAARSNKALSGAV